MWIVTYLEFYSIPIGNWEVEVIFFIKKIRRIVNKNIKCHTRFDVHWFSINRQKSRPAFTSCWQATTKNAIRLLNDEFIMFSPICFTNFFPRIFLSLSSWKTTHIYYWSKKSFLLSLLVEKEILTNIRQKKFCRFGIRN